MAAASGASEPRGGPEASGASGARELLKPALGAILRQSSEARAAFEAMLERGLTEEQAREEVARLLLGVMYHVGEETEMVRAAGGGAGLRRECFRRLAEGETAAEIFGR